MSWEITRNLLFPILDIEENIFLSIKTLNPCWYNWKYWRGQTPLRFIVYSWHVLLYYLHESKIERHTVLNGVRVHSVMGCIWQWSHKIAMELKNKNSCHWWLCSCQNAVLDFVPAHVLLVSISQLSYYSCSNGPHIIMYGLLKADNGQKPNILLVYIFNIYFNHHFREFPIKHSTLFQWQQLHMSHVWSFLLGLPTCCLFTVASGGIGYTYFSLCHLMYTPWCLYNQNHLTAYFQNVPCCKTMHDICYLMICFAKLELNSKLTCVL